MSERTTIGQEIVARANSLDEIATYIDDLRAKNYELTVKLSEFKEGLPIEKAKTDGTEYWFKINIDGEIKWYLGSYCADCRNPDYVWQTEDQGPLHLDTIERVYPLPSTETQMEGE